MAKSFRAKSARVLKESHKCVSESVDALHRSRYARRAFIRNDLNSGAFVAASAGLIHLISHNKSFVHGCALMASSGVIMAGGLSLRTFFFQRPEIRRATYLVGSALFKASKKNGKKNLVANFLRQNKYIYVNGKREVVGSNMPRFFWAGYIKLKSKLILEGKYQD